MPLSPKERIILCLCGAPHFPDILGCIQQSPPRTEPLRDNLTQLLWQTMLYACRFCLSRADFNGGFQPFDGFLEICKGAYLKTPVSCTEFEKSALVELVVGSAEEGDFVAKGRSVPAEFGD